MKLFLIPHIIQINVFGQKMIQFFVKNTFLQVLLIGNLICNDVSAYKLGGVDSLIAELGSRSGKEKVQLYLEITKLYAGSKPIEGVKYGKKGLELAENLNLIDEKILLLSNIAFCLRILGNYNISLEHYLSALDYAQERNDTKIIADVENQIGHVYNYVGNLEKALEYYHSALDIRKTGSDSLAIAGSYNNIGNIYKVKNENNKALEYLNKALEIKNKLGKTYSTVSTLKNMGNVYFNLKNYNVAQEYFEKALEIEKQFGNKYSASQIYLLLGQVYLKKKQYGTAEKFLIDALEQNKEINAKHNIITCNLWLARLFREKRNFEKAANYYEDYTLLREEVYTEELGRQMLEVNTIYEMQEKDKEIYELELNEQVLIRNVVIGFSLLIIIISVRAIYGYKQKAKTAKALAKINKDLSIAKQNAERANMMKSDFLAQMSHEIRTPINTIMNYSSLLRLEFEDKVSADLEGSFDSIENGANRLLRTIDLILNMSDIESGTYEPHFEKITLYNKVVKPVYSECKSLADRKKLKISVTNNLAEDDVVIDVYTISQLLINLVDNAIKYTQKGHISITLYEKDGIKGVDVADTGIGISKEYLPYLFKKFSQEEQGYSRKFEGTGLGLSLAKKYCEINNAEILVESEKGKGTKFTVLFSENNKSVS